MVIQTHRYQILLQKNPIMEEIKDIIIHGIPTEIDLMVIIHMLQLRNQEIIIQVILKEDQVIYKTIHPLIIYYEDIITLKMTHIIIRQAIIYSYAQIMSKLISIILFFLKCGSLVCVIIYDWIINYFLYCMFILILVFKVPLPLYCTAIDNFVPCSECRFINLSLI